MVCEKCGNHTNKTTAKGCFHEHNIEKCVECGNITRTSVLKKTTPKSVSY